MDLLAGPGLFGRAWPRLCAGYVADAIGREVKPWQRLDAGAVLVPTGRWPGRARPDSGARWGSTGWPPPNWLALSRLPRGGVPTSWRSPVSGRTTM
jgi:hypothetical protein